jgi:hypothetical protein
MVLSTGENKPEYCKLKLTTGIGNKESAFTNCLKKPSSQHNLGNVSHMDPTSQQGG